MVRRIIQSILKITIGIFLLVILLATGSFLYVYFHKDAIIKRVASSLDNMVNGDVSISKINIDFFHYFPRTAIHLQDVSLRDSLFSQHKMEFLHADDVFVKISFRDLFSSTLNLENISFHNGSVYIFRDKTGYTNDYLLRSSNAKKDSGFKTFLNEISLKNFRFIYNDRVKDRFFNMIFNDLTCSFHDYQGKLALAIISEGKIKMFSFNLKKGAYARNATFSNNIIAYYDRRDNSFDIPPHTFYLNGQLIEANALLHFSKLSAFTVDLASPRIMLSEALKLVTNRTAKVLSKYQFERPLRISVHLEGSLEPGKIPLVTAELITTGNTVSFKDYKITQSRLNAFYSNRADTSLASSVQNTRLNISAFSGNWEGIPVIADTITIFNFPYPSVATTLRSTFPLTAINRLSGGGLFHFSEGMCTYQLIINANSDSTNWNTDLQARIEIKKGSLVYEPRGMSLHDLNAVISIDNNDVHIDTMQCRSGSSHVSLKGKAPGLLSGKSDEFNSELLTWEIKSPSLNLHDFTSFLGSRKQKNKSARSASGDMSRFGKQMDQYLNACKLRMTLNFANISFDKFTATHLTGTVNMIDNSWLLDDIRFNHGDGSVHLEGRLTPVAENLQSVSIRSGLKNVNISKVFEAFDNFSQTTITGNQIAGVLNAYVKLNFNMDQKAVIYQSSINGLVDLTITEGELKGFQPLGKLSKYLFRKRDFSNIKFSELTNSFNAKGSEIYFDRMKINSNVMELYLEGSYFLNGKTDMRIQVPLSNLKKRDWEELSDNITDKGEKGMNVFIHASTDEKGELRFKYDPLKKIKDKQQFR